MSMKVTFHSDPNVIYPQRWVVYPQAVKCQIKYVCADRIAMFLDKGKRVIAELNMADVHRIEGYT